MIKKMIPYGKQDISQDDIDAVVKVLQSDWLTQGPKVPEFERTLASYCSAKHAVAVNSATSALHIACLALNVGKEDIVWTSPISFVASANCALYCGASIDFIDIDLHSGNISIDCLAKKLLAAKKQNKLPKVVIPVHLAGQSCDMQAIKILADKYNFKIIEDASHAIGGSYQGSKIGHCKYSDIAVFSFHPVKIITSAEGGMALTNCNQLDERLRLYRSHGITSEPTKMTEESHGPWYYQQIALGFNYRMTDIQAALGISQLSRIDEIIEKRNELACRYDKAFLNTTITSLTPTGNQLSAYHLYLVLLTETNKKTHKEIIIKLRQKNICAHVHYIPIYQQPYYQALGFNAKNFPNAEEYYSSAISLPLFPLLDVEKQQYIIDTLLELI